MWAPCGRELVQVAVSVPIAREATLISFLVPLLARPNPSFSKGIPTFGWRSAQGKRVFLEQGLATFAGQVLSRKAHVLRARDVNSNELADEEKHKLILLT